MTRSPRRRKAERAAALATLAAVIPVPIVVVLCEAAVSSVHVAAVIIGSLIGAGFFAVTAAVVILFDRSPQLQSAVMLSYVTKTAVLALGMVFVPVDSADRLSLAIAIGASAVVYLFVQTTLMVRKPRWTRLSRMA